MSISQYGLDGLTYGGTNCTAPVYGVSSTTAGEVSGNISDVIEWVEGITLTSNIYIVDGGAVVIECDATINNPNNYKIIIRDGGYLNTRGQRLPRNSAIGSIVIIT